MKLKFELFREIKIFATCSKCGRILKNPKSIAMGIGPVCLAKTEKKRRRQSVLKSATIPRLFYLEEEENVDESGDRKLPKS